MREVRSRALPALLFVCVLVVASLAPMASGIYIGKLVEVEITKSSVPPNGSSPVVVTVREREHGDVVPDVEVRINASEGHMEPSSAVTNSFGRAGFTFYAPDRSPPDRVVDIEAVAIMGSKPYPTDTDRIYIAPTLEIAVNGPRIVEAGGVPVEYEVGITATSEPVDGAQVQVVTEGGGAIDEPASETDALGRTWFNLTPPAEVGQLQVVISAEKPSHTFNSTSLEVSVVEEVLPLELEVATDRVAFNAWGSCNLSATVKMGDTPVEGATVTWEADRGWLESNTSVTGADGVARVVYTASVDQSLDWVGDRTITAVASDGYQQAEGSTGVVVHPENETFEPDIDPRPSAGQLLPGETLSMGADISAGPDQVGGFIHPVDVRVVYGNNTTELQQNVTIATGLTVNGPGEWEVPMTEVYTVPSIIRDTHITWDVQLVSGAGDHVYSSLSEVGTSDVLIGEVNDWTFLLYLSADNSLSGRQWDLVDSLESQAPYAGIEVLIQSDGYMDETTPERVAWRMRLSEDERPGMVDSQFLSDLGPVDSGSADTLLDFLLWGAQLAPARHYCVVVWDHGQSFYGLSYDRPNLSHINLSEMAPALDRFQGERRRAEVTVLDMCYMSTLAVLHQLKDATDYIVAAESVVDEDLLTPYALHYVSVAQDYLRDNPGDVSFFIAQGAYETYGTFAPVASLDAEYADGLFEDLGTLADLLLTEGLNLWTHFWNAKQACHMLMGPAYGAFSLVDLDELLSRLEEGIQSLEGLIDDSLMADFVNVFTDLRRDQYMVVDYAAPWYGYGGLGGFLPPEVDHWTWSRDAYTTHGQPATSGWVRVLDGMFGSISAGSDLGVAYDVPGFNGPPVADTPSVDLTEDPHSGDIQAATVTFPVDNGGNEGCVTVAVDMFALDGSRGWPGRLVDRHVAVVEAGGSEDVEATLTTPQCDTVALTLTVLASDGQYLQGFQLGEYDMVATPREGSPPTVDLGETPVELTAGKTKELTAEVEDDDGDEVKVYWDLDDWNGLGIDAIGETVSTSYWGPRNLTVTCHATDGHHWVTATLDVAVVAPTQDRVPSAELNLEPVEGLTVLLDASPSSDPDGDAMWYRFDFGDGLSTAWLRASSVEHTYGAEGTYQVRVTVHGSNRTLTANATQEVEVPVSPSNEAPTAVLSLSVTQLEVGESLMADGASSSDPEGGLLEYRVDWGDGNVSVWGSGPSAVHAYDTPGNYTVTLTVRDPGALTAQAQAVVEVLPVDDGGDGGGDDDDDSPGPGAMAALSALAAAAMAVTARRRRRR